MLLQLLHDHPYASWRDIGKHFPTRTIAAVKARGALLAKKLPRKSLEGMEHMEDGILENEPSFLKVSHGWTKEDVRNLEIPSILFIHAFLISNVSVSIWTGT